jgi:hypothetical protein
LENHSGSANCCIETGTFKRFGRTEEDPDGVVYSQQLYLRRGQPGKLIQVASSDGTNKVRPEVHP